MTTIEINKLRDRAAHYLSYEVAKFAGMQGLGELQQFVVGTVHPTEEILVRLSHRIGMPQ